MTGQPPLDEAFLREARLGLTVVAVLLCIFCYVAYGKYSGWYRPNPVTYAAVVDPDTGEETRQRFSPFAAVKTDISPPADARPESGTGSDRSPTSRSPDASALLLPAASGGATVPQPAGLPTGQTEILSGGSFTPTISAPARLTPDTINSQSGDTARDVTTREFKAAPPAISPHVFRDPSVQQTGFANAERDPASATAPTPIASNPIRNGNLEAATLRAPQSPLRDSDRSQRINRSLHPPETQTTDDSPDRLAPDSGNRVSTSVTDVSGSGDGPDDTLPVPRGKPSTSIRNDQATSIVSQDGDSFWLIAQRVYGDGRYFNALYESNRTNVASFNDLPVGTRISTPAVEELRRLWPALCPEDSGSRPPMEGKDGEYTTRSGDTLFDIARDQLGQASRYLELLQRNADRLPSDTGHATRLPEGIKLLLPPR